jgi:putative addiction module CopG family antidote
MNLALRPDLKRLIQERVKSGKYNTAEDVIAAALTSLDQQERCGDFEPGELDVLLGEGEQSIEEDGTLDGEQAFRRRRRRRAQARNGDHELPHLSPSRCRH